MMEENQIHIKGMIIMYIIFIEFQLIKLNADMHAF